MRRMTGALTTDLDDCPELGPVGCRCQLRAGHNGVHAALVGDAYLAWTKLRVSSWSAERPPPWLLFLPWGPGRQPVMPTRTEMVSFDSA